MITVRFTVVHMQSPLIQLIWFCFFLLILLNSKERKKTKEERTTETGVHWIQIRFHSCIPNNIKYIVFFKYLCNTKSIFIRLNSNGMRVNYWFPAYLKFLLFVLVHLFMYYLFFFFLGDDLFGHFKFAVNFLLFDKCPFETGI